MIHQNDALIQPKIGFEAQGSLIKLKVTLPSMTRFPAHNAKRGQVSKFSRKSRKRLLEKTARLDLASTSDKNPIIFITLTYGQIWPKTSEEAKSHLRAMLERIRRFAPQSAGFWRLEFQERGAPHFHLLLFNLPFIPKKTLQNAWGEIINLQYWDNSKRDISGEVKPPFTRIEAIASGRRAVSYVAKYVAKVEPEKEVSSEAASGFNNVPYLHAGRWWGVFNSEFLPFAEIFESAISLDSSTEKQVFFNFRRLMARKHRAVKRFHELKGGTLFVQDVEQWIDYWFFLWLEHAQ